MAGPAYSSAGGATNHMRGRRPTHMADAAEPFFMPCMGMKKGPAASYSRAGGAASGRLERERKRRPRPAFAPRSYSL